MAGSDHSPVIVVADAGPLIHLDELAALDVLSDLGPVMVPNAVWLELERHRPAVLSHSPITLVRRQAENLTAVIDALAALYTLHLGEKEALACCLAHERALLLTDDTAARLAAKSAGIPAHGTIGLLVRAIRRGLRSKDDVVALLSAIPSQSTLHIRPSFLAEILRDVARLTQ